MSFKKRIAAWLRLPFVRYLIFFLSLLPLANLVYAIFENALGPDPAEKLSYLTGEWALYFLFFTLAITPLSKIKGMAVIASFRRMLGLYSFFYACLHLLVFIAVWLAWDIQDVFVEVSERPYIAAGFVSWLLMLPLAITSTRKWRQRLGKSWKKLHKAVYFAVTAALVHIVWQVRSDSGEFYLYLAVFLLLMLSRIKFSVFRKQ